MANQMKAQHYDSSGSDLRPAEASARGEDLISPSSTRVGGPHHSSPTPSRAESPQYTQPSLDLYTMDPLEPDIMDPWIDSPSSSTHLDSKEMLSASVGMATSAEISRGVFLQTP